MTAAAYDRIRASTDPNHKLVAGLPQDRLSGLGHLLETAKGKSVLDVACHNGTIAAAFAEARASVVHGVDFWAPGIKSAREALRNFPDTETLFEMCDLSGGLEAIEVAIPTLRQEYDLVLYPVSFTIFQDKSMHTSILS